MSESKKDNKYVFSVQLNRPGDNEDGVDELEETTRRKAIESQLLLSGSPLSPPPLRTDVLDDHFRGEVEADLEEAETEAEMDQSGTDVEYDKTAASPPSTPSAMERNAALLANNAALDSYYPTNPGQQYSDHSGDFYSRDHASKTPYDHYSQSNQSIPEYVSSSRMSAISSTANFFDRPEKKILVPPLNFAMVASGIYRSGHPLPINFPFLETLKLKTIIFLGEQDLREVNVEWAAKNGIRVIHNRMESCKLPFVENDPQAIEAALSVVVDSRNFPILIHSNKGKHRVGVLVGAMRKLLQKWSLASIFHEYGQFAAGKEDSDIEFIELFNAALKYDPKYAPSWLI
ncbi:tyrosine phosphatase family-domain-containing protein [Myxozyma melibiosi]|uniref:Tyrosine phosphatase family-domain-containing protein n=1 Tax=Myxozyma melibiosi TaxID=54550 RepID=A0ABR1F7L9_9ASCO